MPDDEGLREELAAALLSADYESIDFGEWRDLVGDEERDQYDAYLDALLPVVERYAARRAAEVLRAAADEVDDWGANAQRYQATVEADSIEHAAATARLLAYERAGKVLRRGADALAADGTEPHPAHRHDETEAGRG